MESFMKELQAEVASLYKGRNRPVMIDEMAINKLIDDRIKNMTQQELLQLLQRRNETEDIIPAVSIAPAPIVASASNQQEDVGKSSNEGKNKNPFPKGKEVKFQ